MPTPCRGPWWIDETYVNVSSQRRYIYRAIDQFGQVIDAYGSPRRDAGAARGLFTRALSTIKAIPMKVTTDKAAVYPRVVVLCGTPHKTNWGYSSDRTKLGTRTLASCCLRCTGSSASGPAMANY
jgi:transposase-like protein